MILVIILCVAGLAVFYAMFSGQQTSTPSHVASFDPAKYPRLKWGQIYSENGIKSQDVTFTFDFPDNPKGTPYYIIVDTETSGLIKRRNRDPHSLSNWPRIVQICYMIFDREGRLIKEECEYFQQPRPIPLEAVAIHGITDEICKTKGVDPAAFLYEFWEYCQLAEYLVGHNIKFDYGVIEANMRRFKISDNFQIGTICTMESSKDFAKVPIFKGASTLKNPNLNELVGVLFYPPGINSNISGHKADLDAAYTAQCFFEMKKRGWIKN